MATASPSCDVRVSIWARSSTTSAFVATTASNCDLRVSTWACRSACSVADERPSPQATSTSAPTNKRISEQTSRLMRSVHHDSPTHGESSGGCGGAWINLGCRSAKPRLTHPRRHLFTPITRALSNALGEEGLPHHSVRASHPRFVLELISTHKVILVLTRETGCVDPNPHLF